MTRRCENCQHARLPTATRNRAGECAAPNPIIHALPHPASVFINIKRIPIWPDDGEACAAYTARAA